MQPYGTSLTALHGEQINCSARHGYEIPKERDFTAATFTHPHDLFVGNFWLLWTSMKSSICLCVMNLIFVRLDSWTNVIFIAGQGETPSSFVIGRYTQWPLQCHDRPVLFRDSNEDTTTMGSVRHVQISVIIRITWTNKMHCFLLIYFNSKPLHVSSRLAAHQQEDQLCINSNWLAAASQT